MSYSSTRVRSALAHSHSQRGHLASAYQTDAIEDLVLRDARVKDVVEVELQRLALLHVYAVVVVVWRRERNDCSRLPAIVDPVCTGAKQQEKVKALRLWLWCASRQSTLRSSKDVELETHRA